MKHRLLFLSVAMLLTVALFPISALAAPGSTYNDGTFEYTELADGTLSITDYTGTGGAVTIPSSYDPGGGSMSVSTIGADAFYAASSITSVTIPSSVTTIGDEAFCGSSLDNVTIPSSVTTIGDLAFAHTLLGSVTIPSNVTTIGVRAFYYCDYLSSATLTSGLTVIGYEMFRECGGLTSITIPSSVTFIEDGAFYGCGYLSSVTLTNGLTVIGTEMFYDCDSLTSVTIPGSVTTIGSGAFDNCSNLSSVTLNSGVPEIGDSMFFDCISLTSITIPGSVTKIGPMAFTGCDLNSITLNYGLTEIGYSAFLQCTSLTSITFPASLTKIGEWAFAYDTGLTSITIPESVTTIDDGAFLHCDNISSVTLCDGLTVIGSRMFHGCALTSVNIPASVTLIGDNAFEDCASMTTAVIHSKTVAFGTTVFNNTNMAADGIYGFSGSTSETYAMANTIPFYAFLIVTYDSQGGSAVPQDYVVHAGDLVDAPADPTLAGYAFGGWYPTAACNTAAVTFPYAVTADTTLYAKWTSVLGAPYVVPTSTSYSAIQISWTAVTGAEGYEVYYGTKKYGYYSLKYTSYSGAAGSWTKAGLIADKTYYFKVRAFKTVGGVPAYGPYSTIQSTSPGRPTMSVTAVSPTSAAVTWVTVSGSDGYEIWRGTKKSGTYSLKGAVSSSATSWVNFGLTTGKAYYYKVRAFRMIGGVKTFSEFSSINSVVPSASDHLDAPYVVPTSTSYTAIQISWDAVPGANGYEVYYATKKYGTYSLKYTSYSGSAGSWTKGGLTTDKTYYFKVRAFQTIGGVNVYGPDSTIQSTSPGRPTITASRDSATSAMISWVPISGSAGYEVWRGTKKYGTYSLKYTAASSAANWVNAGLTTGKAYYYKVRTFRMIGGVKVYSEFSSINSVVP